MASSSQMRRDRHGAGDRAAQRARLAAGHAGRAAADRPDLRPRVAGAERGDRQRRDPRRRRQRW